MFKGKRLAICLLSLIILAESSLSVIAVGTDGGDIPPSVSDSMIGQTVLEIEPEEYSISINDVQDDTTDGDEDYNESNIAENVSDNAIENVNDNSAESVSDNMTVKTETQMRKELETEAQSELQRIAGEKNIYALVYLTDGYSVKDRPDKNSDTIMVLGSGHTVKIQDLAIEWNYHKEWEEDIPNVWYQVCFYENEILYTGYIEDGYLAYSDELLRQWKEQFYELFPMEIATYGEEIDYSDVERFPASYQLYLKKLKQEHPEWMFVRMDVTNKYSKSSSYGKKRTWEECTTEQLGEYSWINRTAPKEYRGDPVPGNPNWYYATIEGISYYMDPRNFLTIQDIFQFELNSYNETYHTPEAVQKFLNSTFMEGKVPGDSNGYTHAQVIWNSGKNRKLSPFVLAARVIQEQGTKGTSAMISGTYPGYEGYYNYYNIGATGKTEDEILKNGLSYAKSKGWNTRTKALDEGADTLSNGYVSKGQDIQYLQKFDVEKSRGYLFQYMQNLTAAYTEGRSMRSMYEESGVIDKAFVFKIPVFLNMPGYELETGSVVLEKGTEAALSEMITVTHRGMEIPGDYLVFREKRDGNDTQENSVIRIENGVLTALKNGTATIEVSINQQGLENNGGIVGEEEFIGECVVTVISSLKGIEVEEKEVNLYIYDNLADKIPVLNEDGKTEYLTKEECSAEMTLNIQYFPEDTTDDRNIEWQSQNPECVEIIPDEIDSSKAKIIAKSEGTSVVTATSVKGGYTAQTIVNVVIPMMDAEVNEKDITLYQGQSKRVTTSYSPHNTTDAVEPEWYSENPEIADVSDGKIIAKKAGTTVLHAAIGPFDGLQSELTCKVTVKNYRVTFMDVNGTDSVTVSGEYGKELQQLKADDVEIPWNPVKDDKVFVGWYTKDDGEGDEVTCDTILYGDMILYPYFIDCEAEFYVKPIGSLVYTGEYLKPEAEVFHKGKQLVRGKDYIVSYENNKSVGDENNLSEMPTMIIKGKGKYYGKKVTEPFSIRPKDILHSDVDVSDMLTSYNGKVQKMRPVIKDDVRTLQVNKDYILEYLEQENGAYCEAGTYAIKITGKGNYEGTRMAYIIISKRILLSLVTLEKIENVSWKNGDECIPILNLKYNGISLTPEVDYTTNYRNNTEIGTAKVVIVGKGKYIGEREETFRITGADFTKAEILGIEDLEYTGEAVEHVGTEVRDEAGKLLEKGIDYEVTYLNNTEAGKAVAVFNGKGGFEGIIKKDFNVLPYDISKNNQQYSIENESGESEEVAAFQIDMEQQEIVYEKAGAEPEVIVTYKGQLLKEGADYYLKYENNKNIEETTENPPTVIINGKGNFKGSVYEEFKILPKELNKTKIMVRDVKFRNKRGFCFVEPELKDESGRKLIKGVDYHKELKYTYGTDVVLQNGTIRFAGDEVLKDDIPTAGEQEDAVIIVTVFGKGNYVGSHFASYRILKNTSQFSLEDYQEELKNDNITDFPDKLETKEMDSVKTEEKQEVFSFKGFSKRKLKERIKENYSGVNLEKGQTEKKVYCVAADRSLGIKEFYRLGFVARYNRHYWKFVNKDYLPDF